MADVADEVEDLADLYVLKRTARGRNRAYLERIRRRRLQALETGVSKAAAARALGVSVNTLDKWIARGRVKVVVNSRTGRAAIDSEHLARLLVHVRELRDAGAQDGVLAAAIARIEREDPAYRAEFDELYGASLQAAATGELKPLEVPDSFGPED